MAAAAAAEGGGTPLQNAMKMAKVAIQLDGGGRHKEAYCEYLRTISYISQALLEDAAADGRGLSSEGRDLASIGRDLSSEGRDLASDGRGLSSEGRDLAAVEVQRMLRLAEQCLERSKSFVEKRAGSAHLSSASSSCPEVPPPSTSDLISSANAGTSPTASGQQEALLDGGGGGERSPFLPPEMFHQLQTDQAQDSDRKELTPIEQASRLNQKLKANYEARLARLTPGQSHQKTSLKLSLQRQMMENLIIAKARQEALQRKMEERRVRLQEEANRRFAASGSMTTEEQEQRSLYTNVLEYEQDHDWPKLWKASLRENPDDVMLVSRLLSYLLSRSDHPVVKLLRKHQYRIYNKLYPIVSKGPSSAPPQDCPAHAEPERKSTEQFIVGSSSSPSHLGHAQSQQEGEPLAERDNSFEDLEQFLTGLDWAPPELDPGSDPDPTCDPVTPSQVQVQELERRALKEHLKATVRDIHTAIDQLLSLCLLSFECLNTSTCRDICLATIEEVFFAPLWSALMALFRQVNAQREQAFERSLSLFQEASPADVCVPLKLFPQEAAALKGSYPYEEAVQELRLLLDDRCPQKKLECIVRTLRVICACAEDYRSQNQNQSTSTSSTAAIGADDLLPVLSFVVLRSRCPQLVSECAALEEFIHEAFLIGEEGYCLTSLQSALSYVESLLPADM